MVNLPDFFTSAVARLAKLSRILEHCDFFRSHLVDKNSATPPLVMEVTAFFFFLTFMATILEVDGSTAPC